MSQDSCSRDIDQVPGLDLRIRSRRALGPGGPADPRQKEGDQCCGCYEEKKPLHHSSIRFHGPNITIRRISIKVERFSVGYWLSCWDRVVIRREVYSLKPAKTEADKLIIRTTL